MSDPARHDDKWGELPRMDEGELERSGPSSRLGAEPPITGFGSDRRLPQEATPSRLGEWPIDMTERQRNQRADRAGRLIGDAVCRVTQLRTQLRDRFYHLQQRFEQARREASEELRSTAHDVRREAKRDFRRARSRADFVAHEYPVQFVLTTAAGAFFIGLVLGWWSKDSD